MDPAGQPAREPPAPQPGPPGPPVDPRRYRDAVGRFPTGVTILTARLGGRHHGMTANSITSVSLDPVLMLVCVDRAARLHDLIMASQEWAVSVLGAGAERVSRLFADPHRRLGEGLAEVSHHYGPHTGAVLLDDALATLECRTVAAYPGGDHTILLGEVLSAQVPGPDDSPLLYYRGEYHKTDW